MTVLIKNLGFQQLNEIQVLSGHRIFEPNSICFIDNYNNTERKSDNIIGFLKGLINKMNLGKAIAILFSIYGVIVFIAAIILGNFFLIFLSIFLFLLAYLEVKKYHLVTRTASITIFFLSVLFIAWVLSIFFKSIENNSPNDAPNPFLQDIKIKQNDAPNP